MYDVLAENISRVHEKFGLNGKIQATVTDNGSNFVKAFASISSLPQESGSAQGMQNDDCDNDEIVDEVTFTDVYNLITPEQDLGDDLTQLDMSYLNTRDVVLIVASSDVDKHLSSDSLSRSVYRSSFGKCSAPWNKASRSTVASDHMQKQSEKAAGSLPTRWNSYYNAVLRVAENSSIELNELCISVELRCFAEKELSFFKEYCTVLKPLSRGLNILQGEDACYFGTLLPTLDAITKRTKATKTGLSSVTTRLVDTVESAIRRRFI